MIADFDRKNSKPLSALPFKSYAQIPIKRDQKVIGIIRLFFQNRYYFSHGEIEFLNRIAEYAAKAIGTHYLKVIDDARIRINRNLAENESSESFLDAVVTDIFQYAHNCQEVSVFLVNTTRQGMDLVATSNTEDKDSIGHISYRKGQGLTGWVWQERKIMRIPFDVEKYPDMLDRFQPKPTNEKVFRERLPSNINRQFMAGPIMRNDEILGVLRVCGQRENRYFFEEDERTLLRICEELSQIIHSLKSLEEKRYQLWHLIETSEAIQEQASNAKVMQLVLAGIVNRVSSFS